MSPLRNHATTPPRTFRIPLTESLMAHGLALRNHVLQGAACRAPTSYSLPFPTFFKNSLSVKISTPNFFALSYFDPGSVPATT
ncbi:MAG: hypothetical protein AMXMBFR16_03530 [Candidatus Uhrbacteria bacterium]